MPTPTLKQFFVYAPDKTDEGTFEKRLLARAKHLELAKQHINKKLVRAGGVLHTPETIDSEQKRFVGSTFICEAATIEEVRQSIESDIYYTTGVWDTKKIVILPILVVVRGGDTSNNSKHRLQTRL